MSPGKSGGALLSGHFLVGGGLKGMGAIGCQIGMGWRKITSLLPVQRLRVLEVRDLLRRQAGVFGLVVLSVGGDLVGAVCAQRGEHPVGEAGWGKGDKGLVRAVQSRVGVLRWNSVQITHNAVDARPHRL